MSVTEKTWNKIGLLRGTQKYQALLDKFKDIPLLKGLSIAEIDKVLSLSEQSRIEKETYIIKEGSTPNFMYIILSGSVTISRKRPLDQSLHLTELKSPDFFGEMALADDLARSASVLAKEDCLLLRIHINAFEHSDHISACLYRNIAGGLSQRLRSMNDCLAEQGFAISP